ncbi:MAG: class I SAM-dependent methyltransferase [Planctomycetota bacterium]
MTVPGVGDREYFEHWYADRDASYYGPVLSHVIRHGEPGPILDLGAGTGLLVELARRWELDCRGYEGSADAVAMGTQRVSGLPLTQHTLGEPLPEADASVQTVVMNQVIEHLEVERGRATLRDVLRVLRPGGMIYVASPCRHNPAERGRDATDQHLYVPSELRATLRDAGFAGVVSMDAPLGWPGCRALWNVLGRPDRLCATASCRGYKPG